MTASFHARHAEPLRAVPATLIIERLADPVVEAHGFGVLDDYVETCLLPLMGPSCVVALRRLGTWAALGPVSIPSVELGVLLGMGLTGRARLRHTLHRMTTYETLNLAAWADDDTLAVRTHVARLPAHVARRLPALAYEYHVARTAP